MTFALPFWAVPIRLTPRQCDRARAVGEARQAYAEHAGCRDKFPASREEALRRHVEGAAGELAVSVETGLDWDARIGGDFHKPDVGHVDVRTSTAPYPFLILRRGNPANRIHCKVVGSLPELWICGWIYGFTAMRRQWWRVSQRPDRPSAWWFPHDNLLPLPIPPERFHYSERGTAWPTFAKVQQLAGSQLYDRANNAPSR